MPGPKNKPIDPPLTQDELEVWAYLHRHVDKLAGEIGIRHDSNPISIASTVSYLHEEWVKLGQSVEMQAYPTPAMEAKNLVVEWPGTEEVDLIVVVGAHYDTVSRTPGADDNASAVAMLLAVCKELLGRRFKRTLRFVAFANEEPMHFSGPTMGSRVYADRCKAAGEMIDVMVCLEMVGYFDTAEDSQDYPEELHKFIRPFLRSEGDFIAFVSDMATRSRLGRFKRAFKKAVKFPVVAAPLPKARQVIWVSDHGPFWDNGYPALMVTDTSWFRNHNYHTMNDTPETLDYDRMTRVAVGVTEGVAALAGEVQ
ncbi:MAG: M20/M25/M40 family metallo-hydrolase [Phycisphaeraceae bacterium]|nr:M20/M25/M40 family metallo-hydrolase [Phycisphaeraceae bacterium]